MEQFFRIRRGPQYYVPGIFPTRQAAHNFLETDTVWCNAEATYTIVEFILSDNQAVTK